MRGPTVDCVRCGGTGRVPAGRWWTRLRTAMSRDEPRSCAQVAEFLGADNHVVAMWLLRATERGLLARSGATREYTYVLTSKGER